jgi:hypothetical protein
MSYIGKIPANAVLTTADLADGIVTAAKIEDGTVVAAEIASNAVTTAKINADAVTGAKIADDAINSEHYTDGSIDTAHIADVNVTQGKIADQAINEAKMQISNAPTNGYMLTAQSGNTGGLTWAEAGGGCWTKLDTITISGTTSQLEHEEANFTSTHRDYKIMLSNITVTADAQMRMQVGTDGGSLGSGSNYRFANIGRKSNSATEVQGSAGASSFMMGCTNFGTSSAVFTSNFEINLYNPLSTASYFNMYANGHHTDDNDYTAVFHCAGTYVTGADVALKRFALYLASGDFSGGTSTLYGRTA